MTEHKSSDTARSRSRFRLPCSLLAAAFLLLLVSPCVWSGWRVHRHQVLVEQFEQLGAEVETDPAQGTSIRLSDTQVTDADLQHLNGLTRLWELWLNNTAVTDDGLRHLNGLTSLRVLELSNTSVTDAGLQHLGRLTSLEEVLLNDTPVTNAGLQHLSGLTNLRRLMLHNTQVTDAGADELQLQLSGVEIIR